MALADLPPGIILDGVSGLVLIGFGVLTLLVRPARAVLTGFAVFALAFGLRAALLNLGRDAFDDNGIAVVSAITYGAAAVAILWSGRALVTHAAGTRSAALIVAVVTLLPPVLYCVTAPFRDLRPVQWLPQVQLLLGATFGVLALLALAIRREEDAGARRGFLLIALALTPWVGLQYGISIGFSTAEPAIPTWILIGYFAPPAIVALLWARAAGDARRGAIGVGALLLALIAVGQLLQGAFPDVQDSGILGASRTLSVALLAFALARGGLLGGSIAIRRGTIATGLLAVVLIVAQVAQSFLQAQYGLIMGGIVAGAFLFAAAPLQRALEGRGSVASRAGAGANDDAFRAAVRLAFKDRRFSHDEELALADLAERLGIGARRATEIRHEIEREASATGGPA